MCYNTRSFLTNAVLVTGGESSGGIARCRRCCFSRLRMLICYVGSAFLCPMAVRAYYPNLENVCVHADAIFDLVRNRFGQRIKALQYRYERDGHKLGGVSVLAGGNRKVSPVQVFGAKSPVP